MQVNVTGIVCTDVGAPSGRAWFLFWSVSQLNLTAGDGDPHSTISPVSSASESSAGPDRPKINGRDNVVEIRLRLVGRFANTHLSSTPVKGVALEAPPGDPQPKPRGGLL